MKNILFITTDEQHRESISCYGATSHETPHIDWLAAHGTRYTQAYSVSPVCLPSRCAFMTGMSPHSSGSLSNQLGASLSMEWPNLFTEVKKKGYRTSLHGKCHFIPVPYAATRGDITQEYEHFIFYYKGLGIDHLDLQDDKNNSLWYYDDYGKDLEKAGLMKKYRDAFHMKKSICSFTDFPLPPEWHPDSWVGRHAASYISSLDPEEPHFVWCSFSGPHYPIDAPVPYFKRIDMEKDRPRIRREDEWDDETKYHRNGYYGPGTTEGSGHAVDGAQSAFTEEYWREWRRRYYANVVQIDDWIGTILEAAKAKWGDNFVVVFTSDHGEMMGNHSLWGKNGSLYEDVLRVPLIVYEPGQEPKVVTQRVSSLDIHPTLLFYAGITHFHPLCEGVTLDEDVKRGGRKSLFSFCDNRFAYIDGHCKLEWNLYQRTGKLYKEFYDLAQDPCEFENRYADPDYAPVIRKMEQVIERKEREEHFVSILFGGNPSIHPFYFNGGEGAGFRNSR